jgi:hypothetical protein
MKRAADVSIICVSAVLAMTLLWGPTARQAALPPRPGAPTPPSAAAHRTAGADVESPPADDRGRWRGHDMVGTAREPWSRRVEGPRPGRSTPTPLTPELIDACLAVAQDIDTQLAAQLHQLRKDDPDQFERRLRHSRRLIALAELWQRDPDLYELKKLELNVDAEVIRLARETRQARREGRTADAEAFEKQLQAQVILQLGFSIRAREDYLCRLQELVQQLEAELAREREPEHFNRMVRQRMEELLSDPSVDGPARGRDFGPSDGEADRPPPP